LFFAIFARESFNQNMLTLRIQDLSELHLAAARVINAIPDSGLVLFLGDMGAGKTTLISTICTSLGVTEPISSPTYSLVNTYETATGKLIHHLDLYRIESESELLEAGIEEVFYDNAFVFIEWPQVAYPLIRDAYLEVQLQALETGERELTLETKSPKTVQL
jgi:tRNA threonylcarbamoyladenosine biosynthesis protein TsaE